MREYVNTCFCALCSYWCQTDGANRMSSYGLNIGYLMDHIDPKRLGFVIYLVLRMHQFQKYHLLSSLMESVNLPGSR